MPVYANAVLLGTRQRITSCAGEAQLAMQIPVQVIEFAARIQAAQTKDHVFGFIRLELR